MKYLLVIALVFVVYLFWRAGRRAKMRPPKAGAAPPSAPQDMVRCPVCSVHLPANDAVPGRLASYCSAQHRDQQEG
jgi:uncharacterized protein